MSDEIFPEPTEPLHQETSFTTESEEELLGLNVLTLHDVRITPPHMVFENAYEGKHYQQKLVIQNCGNRLAFVRLCEPNSRTFEFKTFTEGKHLSPGMKIIRIVKYVYARAMGVLRGFTTIGVNDEELRYHFTVKLAVSQLSIKPRLLDFGRIDAVNHATTRTFYIRNSGFKGTQFAIDITRNPLEMIVEPVKGVVPAKSSVAVKVEIVGTQEGEFTEELWIKSNPPLRLVVTGTFISPKLIVRKFISGLDFTLLDFPPTYYGSTATQPLLIRNFSCSDSMFCVMAEIKGTVMTLDEARKIDDNYRNFIIKPIDGRLSVLRGAIIQITFAPVVTRASKDKNYAACFLKVVRMDCRDVTPNDDIFEPQWGSSSNTKLDTESVHASMSSGLLREATVSDFGLVLDEDDKLEENFSFEHSIGVCVHGEKEYAGVILRPTSIFLEGLTLEKVYERELLVVNNSIWLPIRVKYKKVVCVDVHPREFNLGPDESVEVLVTVRAVSLNREEKRVKFDLLAEDVENGGTFRKVGVAELEVSFTVTEIVKKPRMKQCVVCNELPLRLEPEFPHRLTRQEMEKKLQHNEFWLAYIRNLKTKPKEQDNGWQEYDFTSTTFVKNGGKCRNVTFGKTKSIKHYPFYPLPPRLLYNIKIKPKSIRLRKVAAYTTITDFFTIENLNPFPIFAYVRSSKPVLVFEEDSRYYIFAKEKKKIYFNFSNSSTGRYYINLYILVNNSTLYEVTAVAHVVPKALKLETERIEFTKRDGSYKFIKIINSLNSYTSFDWDVPPGCFQIDPPEGGIKAETSLLCMITCSPNPTESNSVECVLTSESGQKRILTVSYRRRQHLVVFDMYNVDFGVIPLNMPVRKKITLKNLKMFQVLYSISEQNPIPGITIDPVDGILDGLDSQVFNINVHLKAVIQFNTVILFYIDEDEEVEITLKGSVEYPQIIVKPETMFFRKITPYSFDTLAFKMTNASEGVVWINFPMDELPEFDVTTSEDDQYKKVETVVLQAEQSKILYLHFHPNYVSTCSVLLPYVINGIIGPVYINSGRSVNPQYFLHEIHLTYMKVKNVIMKKYPRSLSIVRLNCSAIEKTLEFSSLIIKFFYFGENHYNNKTGTTFEIKNVTHETAEVCIRIDDLQSPFTLTPVDDTCIEYYEVSYKIVLEPEQTIVFDVEFLPTKKGDYELKLPIFLRHYYDNKIFNYLTLYGVYDTPLIIPSTYHCDFEPVPLYTTNEMEISLRMLNHFDGCNISADSELPDLVATFDKETISEGETLVFVTLSYQHSFAICFNTTVVFRCTCNTTCSVELTGVTENCLLTTHAFSFLLMHESSWGNSIRKSRSIIGPRFKKKMPNRNTTSFPLFPSDDDTCRYAEYMRSVQKSLEHWVFSQGFYMKGYYRIPEGFSDYCKVRDPAKKRVFGGFLAPKIYDMPLLELIMHIAGKEIRNDLAPSLPKNINENAWLTYVAKTNTNILNYLRNFRVSVPHVKAKYLLNYDQYVQYELIKYPKKKSMEETIFYRLSKQCWIDLILQIIKTFFLFRSVPFIPVIIKERASIDVRYKIRQSVVSVSHLSNEEVEENFLDTGVYGEREKELIDWLMSCYNAEKLKLWSKRAPDRDLIFLDEDLRDGLILGAVTAHYCPYVQSEIKDMYVEAYNPEELHHNACVLVKTWQMLKFSYIVSPLKFKEIGMAEMLLLVSYLYDILPYHCPSEEIKIEAPLTQSNTTTIELENLGVDPIYYKHVFFGNDSHLFTVFHDLIMVEEKSTRTVKIKFHAKTVKTSATTLVFSGETPGHKYGKSVVFKIVGVTDVDYACMKIPLTVDLYKPCEITWSLQSPFKIKAEYYLLFGYQPASQEKNALFPWEEITHIKTIKEFVLESYTANFDEQGQAVATHVICCQHEGPKDMWFYFTNPEVGDWGLQITLTGRVTPSCYERIYLIVPQDYKKLVCRCKRKHSVTNNCPVILHLTLPMKNNVLWNARKLMVMQYVQGEEYNFWFRRIYTPTGTRILKLILNSETHPMRQIIEETVKYKVELTRPSPFVTLKEVVFEDVTSEDYFVLPIHPVKDLLKIKKYPLQLISEDGTETRYYELIFKTGEDTIHNHNEIKP